MSKILIIPDVHGNWEETLRFIKDNKSLVDYVVCLGDYVDDFDKKLNGENMIEGFTSLCKMAREEPNKFKICLGNHDNSYLSCSRDAEYCSGHNREYSLRYRKMFEDNLDILNIGYEIDGLLFSHGGFTKEWYFHFINLVNNIYCKFDEKEQRYKNTLFNRDESFDENDFSIELINNIFHTPHNRFGHIESKSNADLFDFCGWSSSGDSIGESVLWIRPPACLESNWFDCKAQIVGHTELGIKCLMNNEKHLMICDSRTHNEYIIIDSNSIINDFDWEEYYPPCRKFSDYDSRLLALLEGGII